MNEPAPRFPRPGDLAAHLAGAETPALLMTTAHLTHAPEILRGPSGARSRRGCRVAASRRTRRPRCGSSASPGPNTNVIVHGNLVYFLERQVGYLMKALRLLAGGRHRAMSLRPEVLAEHQRVLVQASALRAWGWSNVSSWYKDANGRSPIMWPLSTAEFWAGTETARPEHYVLR
jgi:hypothetical protein